ncbi:MULTISPECIES: MFS transporter [unclassified Nocardioides]|uniref:MFS transporter n=1 Tax=unclassified Nocardioides TaxID=2615069 RepID=UPI0006FD1AEA|nr:MULTISPECIES: MFS transporter [unclassified Nocardioides]KQY62512.1 MFS transporter [Nocardioides sp. Root140]KQZ70540.1 MFS transporter [Nocardioides sp. Root151]
MAHEPRTTVADGPVADPRRWTILGFLGVAQFMLIIDVTVVAIALPHMGADLGLDREATTWVVSAYTLAFGGLMLLGGRIADLLGSRNVVIAGLAVFTVASLVSGVADSSTALLGGRVAQGVGAALLSPAALSAVVQLFDGEERNKALGIWSGLGGAGAAVGVLLGGVLTAGPGWPWVFYVNVPIGVVVTVVLLRVLPVAPGAGATGMRRGSLDVIGAGLVTAATGTAIYALIGAGDRGWTDRTTLLLLLGAVLLYVLFGLRQRTAAVPLMDLALLARRPVAAGTFLVVSATSLMVAAFFLGTFYLQHHADLGALLTGVLFLPIALATMAGATVAGQQLAAVGGRLLTALGFGIAALGFTVAAVGLGTTAVVVGLTIGAVGLGVLFVVAAATALGQVAPHESGIASGIVSTFHEFGASLGAAVVSSVAAASIAGSGTDGFVDGFTLGAAVAVAAGLVAMFLVPGRPAQAATVADGGEW